MHPYAIGLPVASPADCRLPARQTGTDTRRHAARPKSSRRPHHHTLLVRRDAQLRQRRQFFSRRPRPHLGFLGRHMFPFAAQTSLLCPPHRSEDHPRKNRHVSFLLVCAPKADPPAECTEYKQKLCACHLPMWLLHSCSQPNLPSNCCASGFFLFPTLTADARSELGSRSDARITHAHASRLRASSQPIWPYSSSPRCTLSDADDPSRPSHATSMLALHAGPRRTSSGTTAPAPSSTISLSYSIAHLTRHDGGA